MEQTAVEGFQFAVVRARDGGYVISTGQGMAELACACTSLYEVHEWMGRQLADGYRESIHPPRYYQPQQELPAPRPVAAVPQVPRPKPPPLERPVESDPFKPPQFMEEQPLVDRIAAVMPKHAGNGASVIIGAMFILAAYWPFGA